MKLPEIKTESAPGTLTDKSIWGFPVAETDLSVPQNLEITFGDMSRYIQNLIIVEADASDVKEIHRGLRCTITISQGEGAGNYNVVCKSRYKLKNGQTRLKFLTAEILE